MTISPRFTVRLAFILASLAFVGIAHADGFDPELHKTVRMLSPVESMATMQLPPGYRVELVASEPMVEEPVAIAWDGDGRMYVAEMRAYMQDADGNNQFRKNGRITLLEDTDDDGRMDKHTVFVDGLVLPRMILPLHDGRVVVRETNTFDLYTYRDTDGDGKADEKKLFHKGGGRGGNLEHQPSGLIWNIDNWMYVTYSGHRYRYTGGTVTRQSIPYGGPQWGLTHDDVGRVFYSSAGGENPVIGFQQPPIYGNIAMPGEQAPGFRAVYPIDNIPDVQGGPRRIRKDNTLNVFTASCGQSIFRGTGLPADWRGDLLICEPVGRLVRRAKVTNHGGKLVVSNAYDKKEFIAATDANFRPVNSATGPDGCLYIVDMYRGIIQEGNWVRKGSYLRGVVDKYGLDKNIGSGRIYRIVHESTKREPKPSLLKAKTADLVAHLSHDNGWRRDEAQKLIVLRGDKSVVSQLTDLVRDGKAPLGRLHALWTLEGLDAIDPTVLAMALKDTDARVRAAAVRLSEPSLAEGDDAAVASLAAIADDADPNVAIQIVLSLTQSTSDQAGAIVDRVLAKWKDNEAVKRIGSTRTAQRQKLALEAKLRRENAELAGAVQRGAVHYQTLRFACHGADGKGAPVPDQPGVMLAPPLGGSPRAQGSPQRLVRILLHGLNGPVDGKTYPAPMVPPVGQSDAWIADVLTYVRQSFGNKSRMIDADTVKRIRAASKGRTTMWTLGELDRYEPQLLNRAQWKLTSSVGRNVRSAADGNPRSRWDTGGAQRPGMWFTIELPESTRLGRMVLDATGSPRDGPAQYKTEVSTDGKTWKTVADKQAGATVTEIDLKGATGRFIRITQTGSKPGLFWSIHELTIEKFIE